MNSRVTVAIAFKLFSIWLIVQMILQIPVVWELLYLTKKHSSLGNATEAYPYFVLISIAFCGVIAAAIIYKIGNSVLAKLPDNDISLESEKFESMLLQLLGAFFVITSLSYLPNIVLPIFKNIQGDDSVYWARVSSQIFKIIVGVLMISKPKFIQHKLQNFR